MPISWDVNKDAFDARVFSLRQFHQVFHLLLRRSKVRSRLDVNDSDTVVLQNKVDELEKWRIDLEDRLATKHAEIQVKFDNDDERFKSFKYSCELEFEHAEKEFKKNDRRDDNNQKTFSENEQERDDLAERCTKLEERLSETKLYLEDRMDDKIHMMTDHVDVVEKHLTLQIEKANKEIDRLKFDMIDLLDQRHEQMMKTFD